MKQEITTVDTTDDVPNKGKLLRTNVVYKADLSTTENNNTNTDI